MENRTRHCVPLLTSTSLFLCTTATLLWFGLPTPEEHSLSGDLVFAATCTIGYACVMTWHGQQGKALTHGWAPQNVQCTACSPGLAAGFALQAYMSRGQRAVRWAIPVSMSPFTSVFAALSLFKQDRKFVGNYKNVMTKIWVKPCSVQVSGLKGNYARNRFFEGHHVQYWQQKLV